MPLCADCCPADPDEVAEAYCMDALGAADGAAFEVHLLECGECRAIVEATEEYVRAMRIAAERRAAAPTPPPKHGVYYLSLFQSTERRAAAPTQIPRNG